MNVYNNELRGFHGHLKALYNQALYPGGDSSALTTWEMSFFKIQTTQKFSDIVTRCQAHLDMQPAFFYNVRNQISSIQRVWDEVLREKERHDAGTMQLGPRESLEALDTCLSIIPARVQIGGLLPNNGVFIGDMATKQSPGVEPTNTITDLFVQSQDFIPDYTEALALTPSNIVGEEYVPFGSSSDECEEDDSDSQEISEGEDGPENQDQGMQPGAEATASSTWNDPIEELNSRLVETLICMKALAASNEELAKKWERYLRNSSIRHWSAEANREAGKTRRIVFVDQDESTRGQKRGRNLE
ncbi:hypothetical protein V8F33_006098 [Rhypophila sp. PSN 637]